MSSTKSQVAAATNIPNLSSGQQQKDYTTEEHLGRQNSFGLSRRSNMKGKHLTRSHAMRESTSPPRTPTPRASESSSRMSPNGYQSHMDSNDGNNNNSNSNKLQTQSLPTRGNSPIMDAPTVIVTSQNKQQQQQQHTNVALCNEAEFPKLSPPKSKVNTGVSAVGSANETQSKPPNNINMNSGNMNKNYNQSRQQRKLSEGKGIHDALNAIFSDDAQQSTPISNSPMNYQLQPNDGNSQQEHQLFNVYDKENSSNNNNNQRRISNTPDGHNSNNTNNNTSNINCNKKPNDDAVGVNETHNKSANNMSISAGNGNKNYNQSRQQKKLRAGKELQEALSALFVDDSQSTPNCNSPMNYQSHSSDGNSQQQSFIAYDKETNSNNGNNPHNNSSNQRRNINTSDNYNNISNNNNSTTTCSNKIHEDMVVVNESQNMSAGAGTVNKNYNQSRQQRKLNEALNTIYIDDTQPTPICNSPMNYQLHPNDTSSQQQQQSFIAYDKENRCPRNDSRNSMNSGDELHYETHHQQQQQQQQSQQQQHQQQHHQRSGGGNGSGKKHRTNSNSKGSKPRLKNIGSSCNNGGGSAGGGSTSNNCGSGGGVAAGGMASGSIDGSLNSSNNTSGFISRVFTNSENSNEQYTDHGGTDLLSFFKETLNKNVKDRQFLLKVEKDLIEFVQEGNRGEIRFPQASSYNRMLIHRTAAFFGMEHNVDTETQQCVIVAPTKNTRIPEIRFKTLVINNRDDSRKSILKRDTHSFDEARQSSYLCPERGGMLDRKAKSFEEREEDYDRARSRIFNRSQNESCMAGTGSTEEDNSYISWTSSVEQQQFSRARPSGKVLKIQNSPDSRNASNVIQKTNNQQFVNYGGGQNQGGAPLIRNDSANSNKSVMPNGNGTRIFSKQDSAGSSNTSWRLSPSSSGYKTQTQSIRSDSVTPSPTGGYGSDEPHLPDHSSTIANREINEVATSLPNGLVWAVTDISNVPKGSILINPQTLQPILNADGTVYHFDPSNMPPAQAMTSVSNVPNSGIYHTSQNNAIHNTIKKQQKGHQIQQQQQSQPQQQQQQYNKLESATTVTGTGESVSESSTQTVNTNEEVSVSTNIGEISYQDGDICNPDENDECDNSANGCLSITTTTSAKNYDRIEVQKFKNQATSPNIPINEKEDSVKREHSSQTPANVTATQSSQLQHSQSAQQSQTQNRETPHSSRSTPFNNSDTLTKRSSEEPRSTSWTQSYQAPDGSTVFHTTSALNSNGTNPYCTTTYQQGPDGSIYAVPQGMIYAYPPPADGEFQGYFMPVFDPSQQRSDSTSLLQSGAQALYPAGGAASMVPVAAYPTTQFATANGPQIYPGQVIYSGEQFQPAGTPLSATAPSTATTQLQQIPMTTYPIGYPYPYNGYWGQTMTYYVPQQAVPATPILTAPPPSAPGNGSHVAGGVNNSGPNGGISTAGPSINSSNTTNNASGHVSNSNTPNANHPNGCLTSAYQSHVHTVGSNGGTIGGNLSHSGSTTYYGTGRIKRPNPPHFGTAGSSGAPQVLAAASLPNGVATATYQLGHAVPTLTLAAAAPVQTTTGAQATTDVVGNSGAPTTATMYALPQHATIFPANMFPYTTNAAAAPIGPQSASNMASQTAIIQPTGNPQSHGTGPIGGQESASAGSLHNAHHSNTVITHFYTTTHHHAPHPGIHSGGHPIHAPGPSAIPIVDPATIAANVTPITTGANAIYTTRSGGGTSATGTSQSAPSTPHSMPSSNIHHSQRNPTVFSTPPIINNNGGNYNSSNSTPHYYGIVEPSHQVSANASGSNNSNSPHNSYGSSTYEKRNNANGGGGKKPLSYQSVSLSRQNSASGVGYNSNGKPSPLLINANSNNNDLRASPSSSSTNSRPHSIKRGGGTVGGSVINDKPQTPLLSGPPSFAGSVNNQSSSNNNYQVGPNTEVGTANIPIVNVSKPPIRLNAAAAAFRQKGTNGNTGGGSVVEYRRNPTSQRNSPGTNDNSNNNSPNSIHNSSNAATPLAAGCYAPSYMINAQSNISDSSPQHPPSLFITAAPSRGPTHIPPHIQSAANGAAVPAAAAAATASVPQQTATAVLGGAAAAAAAADVANAAAVAAAAATVAHHHHHQPLLGTYNPAASGLYFKYGHTYFAHPSVALQNSRRSPSTDLRPPIAQMAGMYPTVNMMIPAQPRHPGRHPNPNYKGSRPR